MPDHRATAAALALLWGAAGPAAAADLFLPPPPDAAGGGGFAVARVPLRPAPLRFDIYGYPLLVGGPSPLAMGNGCPPALQPEFDPDGNLAGYAPLPMCR